MLWSVGSDSRQVSSLAAKLGIAIWTKASAQPSILRAVWANFKNRENLKILIEGDPVLFHFYGSILVNPAKWPDMKFKEAKRWHNWLTSRPGLDAITSYRIDGQELFFGPHSRS